MYSRSTKLRRRRSPGLGAPLYHRTPTRIIVTHVDGDGEPEPVLVASDSQTNNTFAATAYVATPAAPADSSSAIVTPATVSAAVAPATSSLQSLIAQVPLWGWAAALGTLALAASGGKKGR